MTKTFGLALALTLLGTVLVVPAALAQPGCPHGPGVNYISHDPDECATIQFICAEGQEKFDNECGCGCIETTMAALIAPVDFPDSDELPAFEEQEPSAEVCEGPESQAGLSTAPLR